MVLLKVRVILDTLEIKGESTMGKILERLNHIIELHNEVLYAVRTMRNCIHEYLPDLVAKTLKTDLNIMKLETLSNVNIIDKNASGKPGFYGYKIIVDRYWTDDSIWCHPVVDIKKEHLERLESETIRDIIEYPLAIYNETNKDKLKARLLLMEYKRLLMYLNGLFYNECDLDEKEKLLPHILEVSSLIKRENLNIKRRVRKLTNEE